MKEALYLAGRYLAANKLTTGVLVVSMTLILFLPAGLWVLVRESAASLTARSEQTPLIVGAKGSPLELTLNTLYFDTEPPAEMSYLQVDRVQATGFAEAIPIYCGFQVRQHPIVGTSLDYFDFRGLRTATGRPMATLGECVLGSKVAQALGKGVGDSVISTPQSTFDLGGVYPLKMKICGVLAPTGTPDDNALFTDVKTTWIIAGVMHGHQDLATVEADSILRTEDDRLVANAKLLHYNEVTDANRDSFHLHGKTSELPLTAVIAVPRDERSSALLQGRYLGENEAVQIVVPSRVMEELLATIFTLRSYAITALLIACTAAFATAALVFVLSLRLRKREIATLHKIGAPRSRVFVILASEVVLILAVSALIAAGLTLLTAQFGESAIRSLFSN